MSDIGATGRDFRRLSVNDFRWTFPISCIFWALLLIPTAATTIRSLSTDEPVQILAFSTIDYECTVKQDDPASGAGWHKRGVASVPRPPSHFPCCSPKRVCDGNWFLAKELANHGVIGELHKNGSLVCVASSTRLMPILRWIAIEVDSQQLKGFSSTINLSFPTVGSRKRRLFVSILDVSRLQGVGAFWCQLDVEATCSRSNHPSKYVDQFATPDDDRQHMTDKWSCQVNEMCSKFLRNLNLTFGDDQQASCDPYDIIQESRLSKISIERFCHLLYYSLHQNSGLTPLCREDCFKLYFQYMKLWRRLQLFLKYKKAWFDMTCEQLPSAADSNLNCRQLSSMPFSVKKLRVDCYQRWDRHYVGVMDRTSRHRCQRWDSVCPNFHDFWPELYPELIDAGNSCRNPGGQQESPWCYTEDRNGFAYCDTISSCDELDSLPITGLDGHSSGSDHITLPVWLVSTATCLCAIVFISCIVYRQRLRRHQQTDSEQPVYFENRRQDAVWSAVQRVRLPANGLYYDGVGPVDARLERWEALRDSWKVVRQLSASEHNNVYLAEWQDENMNPKQMVVKSLKEPCTRWRFRDFVIEAGLLIDCQHQRVISLLAVCFMTSPASIVFEFAALGDLKSFLEKSNLPDQPSLYDRDLVELARQIAEGMQYLNDTCRIIHRDLAARNVLLSGDLQVKISDFGMSRQLEPNCDTFIGPEDESLPIRWTAPEALGHRIFSRSSDVWSYGVVVWELMTRGVQPYMGLSHDEVVHQVTVQKSTLGPVSVRQSNDYILKTFKVLMKPCFAFDGRKRPGFAQLIIKADNLL